MAKLQRSSWIPNRSAASNASGICLPLLAAASRSAASGMSAGNRQLHFDEYVTLVLLYLLNPLIDSVHMLQQAAAVEKVARAAGRQAVQHRLVQRIGAGV